MNYERIINALVHTPIQKIASSIPLEDTEAYDDPYAPITEEIIEAKKVPRENISDFLTFAQLHEEYSKRGQHHCLRLTCVKCGDIETCRCSTPKMSLDGVCNQCAVDK